MANNPIVNMFKVKELRERLFFTLVVLAVFRLGSVLTIPGINPQALTAYFDSLTRGNAFVDYMDFFAGGAFSNFSVFMLGVMPYISTQIIMQLALIIFPSLKRIGSGLDSNWNSICLFDSVLGCNCVCYQHSWRCCSGKLLGIQIDCHDQCYNWNNDYYLAG